MDRYFAAFEAGTMQPSTCQDRLDGLQARLDALIAEEQALLIEEVAEVPPTRSWWPSGREPRRRPLQRHGANKEKL